MWDALITLGNLIIIPAMLKTVLDKHTYIPRLSSGLSLVGIAAVLVGLVGAELYLSAIVISVIGAMWGYLFLFRARPFATPVVELEPTPADSVAS